MRQFFKTELNNWKIPEIIWLCSSVFIIISLSIYWNDSIIGIIAAVSGVVYVILTGKGRPSGYIFGVVNFYCMPIFPWAQDITGKLC